MIKDQTNMSLENDETSVRFELLSVTDNISATVDHNSVEIENLEIVGTQNKYAIIDE